MGYIFIKLTAAAILVLGSLAVLGYAVIKAALEWTFD